MSREPAESPGDEEDLFTDMAPNIERQTSVYVGSEAENRLAVNEMMGEEEGGEWEEVANGWTNSEGWDIQDV